jgi:hypothetical protein
VRGERRNITFVYQANIDHPLGRDFERANYTKESLQDVLTVAQALRDETREQRIQHLITTAEGRYDFNSANLNSMVNIVPQTFQEWLVQAWSS